MVIVAKGLSETLELGESWTLQPLSSHSEAGTLGSQCAMVSGDGTMKVASLGCPKPTALRP